MKNNKNKLQRKAFNHVFVDPSEDSIKSPIIEESKLIQQQEETRIKKEKLTEDLKEEVKEEIKEQVIEEIQKETKERKKEKKQKDTTRKTYNIPIDIAENMEKIVYMDRDIKDNTELLIKALRKYLDSKYCKELLEEYKKIKGEN